MVPLHFLTPHYDLPVVPVNINCQGPPLTPLHRAWAFGEALRRAADSRAGAYRRWSAPAASRTGRRRPTRERSTKPGIASFSSAGRPTTRQALLSYTDEETYRDAGQGGFEIRTFIAVAAAAKGRGTLQYYRAIPAFAVGCTVADMSMTAEARPDPMSHMTLEYSSNLRAAGRFDELCRKLAQFMTGLKIEGQPVFPPGGIRVRAVPCQEYCIADGSVADAGFVHAVLKIGAGRSDAAKNATTTGLFDIMKGASRCAIRKAGTGAFARIRRVQRERHAQAQ